MSDEITVYCSYTNILCNEIDEQFVNLVKRAYQNSSEEIAVRMGGAIEDANQLLQMRLICVHGSYCGLGDFVQKMSS